METTDASIKSAIEGIQTPVEYIENFMSIRAKSGAIVDLKLKPAQKRLYEIIKEEAEQDKPIRIVILKARQLGFSTLIEALYFQDAATRENVRTLIVAHDVDSTTNLFRMNKLFYEKLPEWLKPMRKASNAKEIIFENPTRDATEKAKAPGLMSMIKCVPATGASVGRSDTLTNVHASEVAFWRDMDETFTALLQAVPDDPNTSVIVETTPNGYNSFKDFWDRSVRGETGFKAVFFPWYEDPNYRRSADNIELTEEEQELKIAYGLDDEQISWRRWCIANNCGGDVDTFHQEYPSNPEEAFLTSGNPYFNNVKIINRLNELSDKTDSFSFVYGEEPGGKPLDIQKQNKGCITVYEEPKERIPYVCGCDTAGDGSDRFTAYVIDNTTGNQVAELLYDGSSELYFAQQVYCLGMMYNEALIGVEINFSTYPEKKLEEWQYPNLYIREKVDDARNQLSVHKLGWRTDMRTRPLILANLHTIVEQSIDMIRSKNLLREMLTFIRNEQMRPEAAEGEHDDQVMAAAICYGIRNEQSFEALPEPEEERVKLIDRLDPHHKRRR